MLVANFPLFPKPDGLPPFPFRAAQLQPADGTRDNVSAEEPEKAFRRGIMTRPFDLSRSHSLHPDRKTFPRGRFIFEFAERRPGIGGPAGVFYEFHRR